MPVDRKLALETLRKLDEDLYYICSRLEEIKERLSSNSELHMKLKGYLLSLDALDCMESQGEIEIINDYEKRGVFVRRMR
ncbi:MAG: hypothetical protein ACPL3B_01555 [Fervidobacterium sp.]